MLELKVLRDRSILLHSKREMYYKFKHILVFRLPSIRYQFGSGFYQSYLSPAKPAMYIYLCERVNRRLKSMNSVYLIQVLNLLFFISHLELAEDFLDNKEFKELSKEFHMAAFTVSIATQFIIVKFTTTLTTFYACPLSF